MDRAGIPAALIATLVSVARHVGANRIVPGAGVPHVVGNPDVSLEEERRLRRGLVERALLALAAPVEGPRVF